MPSPFTPSPRFVEFQAWVNKILMSWGEFHDIDLLVFFRRFFFREFFVPSENSSCKRKGVEMATEFIKDYDDELEGIFKEIQTGIDGLPKLKKPEDRSAVRVHTAP